jgi:hypothetical protein
MFCSSSKMIISERYKKADRERGLGVQSDGGEVERAGSRAGIKKETDTYFANPRRTSVPLPLRIPLSAGGRPSL